MKRDARNGRDGVLRGTPSTVATVATVAERKRWGGILPPHHQGGCPILGHPKSIRGCRDSRHPMPRNRAPSTGAKSVRRTRSHRMKFCVQKGLGGTALNKQTAGNVSVYKHSQCLPDLCVAIHTHCLPVSKTTETALVPLRKINRNSSIER